MSLSLFSNDAGACWEFIRLFRIFIRSFLGFLFAVVCPMIIANRNYYTGLDDWSNGVIQSLSSNKLQWVAVQCTFWDNAAVIWSISYELYFKKICQILDQTRGDRKRIARRKIWSVFVCSRQQEWPDYLKYLLIIGGWGRRPFFSWMCRWELAVKTL